MEDSRRINPGAAPGNEAGMSAEDAAEDRALRAEWTIGDDGLPRRDAARVVAFDGSGRILLVLGHDGADRTHRWFFTPGGGIDQGESARDAAAREFREETGVRIASERLIGPVLRRHAVFYFADETRRQDEQFFVVQLSDVEAEMAATQEGAELTLWERELLDGMIWWNPAAPLASGVTEIYPAQLGEFARRWWGGWDGTVLEIWED